MTEFKPLIQQPDRAPPSAPAGGGIGRAVLSAWYILIIFFATALTLVAPQHLSRPFLAGGVVLGTMIFLGQCVYHATGPRPINWLSIDILFMLIFLMIHLTYPLFFCLGQIGATETKVWFNYRVVCQGTMMSVAGLAAFGLGFNLLADRYHHGRGSLGLPVAALWKWEKVGKGIFLGGVVVMVVFVLLLGRELFAGEYALTRRLGYAATVLWIGFRSLLFTGFALLTVSVAQLTGKFKIGTVPKVFLVGFVVFMGVFGSRDTVGMIVLIVAGAYAEHIKAISLKKLVVALVAGLLVFSLIRVARAVPERSLTAVLDAIRGKSGHVSVLGGLVEIGNSAQTLYASLGAVPEQYGYFLGKLWYTGIIGLVPFANRLLPELGLSQYANTGTLVTFIMYGKVPGEHVAGAGASIIADFYLNFGLPGVLVGMLGLGVLAKGVQQKARSGASIVWMVAYVVLIPALCIVARNSAVMLVRTALWPALLVFVAGWLFQLPRSARLLRYFPAAVAAPGSVGPPVGEGAVADGNVLEGEMR